ncbi:methylated-DNA--[protein]-cysteine S-methyltransferase [Diaphorobacter ruginosibacter]|uniref:methylated-DNA--[protein]-cysteine S-methyltransferase n=1 Tax=Diaphorobacter ruginosibacter TaxID=1715720 RepID=UPI003341D2C8
MTQQAHASPARPAPLGACLFATPIGECALAWSEEGICAVQLPEADSARTFHRLLRGLGRLPDTQALLRAAQPAAVTHAVRRTQSLLSGTRDDLLDVVLDMRGVPDFACRVYALTRAIDPGRTRTYGELARELGDVHLSRAVGQALGANPFAPIVPCHRVLAANDRAGGFSAHGGAVQKLRMLDIEGACPGGTLPLF